MPKHEFDEAYLSTVLDPKILPYVIILNRAGIFTIESCDGDEGHAFPEPTIRFHGAPSEGMRAMHVAMENNFPIATLRRVWRYTENEMVGPDWELTLVASRL